MGHKYNKNLKGQINKQLNYIHQPHSQIKRIKMEHTKAFNFP